MRQRGICFLVLLFFVLLLTSCSQEQTNAKNEDAKPAFLDVQLTIQPEQGEVNQPVIFQAMVTYGEKEVTDADSVEFEIWRSKDENHEKVKVDHKENGVYELEKSFSEEGTYYIYAHVTAENMHNMPKKEFVIGQPSEPEE